MDANIGAGRPMTALILNASEQEQVQVWSRRRRTAQALALGSRVTFACADGCANKVVAAKLGMTPGLTIPSGV